MSCGWSSTPRPVRRPPWRSATPVRRCSRCSSARGADALPIARERSCGCSSATRSRAALDRALTRCSLACPEPARISHVGVMLGRSLPAMRVHVRGVPLRELAGYLGRIGWVGDPEEIASLARALLDYGDWVVVCLDILADQVVRVGLECFFAEKRGLDPRWRPLLERLTDLGLSSADKAARAAALAGDVHAAGHARDRGRRI